MDVQLARLCVEHNMSVDAIPDIDSQYTEVPPPPLAPHDVIPYCCGGITGDRRMAWGSHIRNGIIMSEWTCLTCSRCVSVDDPWVQTNIGAADGYWCAIHDGPTILVDFTTRLRYFACSMQIDFMETPFLMPNCAVTLCPEQPQYENACIDIESDDDANNSFEVDDDTAHAEDHQLARTAHPS
jgi:hypothetical protein